MLTKITIDASRLDTQERIDKINDVAIEMHTVVNSRLFMDAVLRMNKKGERSVYKDLSNAEVYKMIMEGSEILDPVKDHELDIFIDDFFSMKRIIGYTKRNIKTIFVNTRFFDKRHRCLIGSNILHEASHKLGFGHDFRSTPDRPFSVSYQLNGIYETCYRKIFNIHPYLKTVTKRNWKTLWTTKKSYEVLVWPEY